ncbi:MAG: hypothetical protein ACKVG7_04185 [Flavobacteriales bacterium]
MKKLLLILIFLFSLNTLAYASFPVTENSSSDISNTVSFQMADEEEGDDDPLWFLAVLFLGAVGLAAYFLIRSWWRAWRDDIRWVKILTYILLVPLLLYLLILVFLVSIGYGYGN